MSLWRWIRLNGLRRGVHLWRINQRLRDDLRLAAWRRRHEPQFRIHHGEKPRLTGYRRR